MSGLSTTRRAFVQGAAGFAVASTLLPASASARARLAGSFDPSFGSARSALAALRGRVIGARELVSHCLDRIRKFNPRINAFVTLVEEQALAQAAEADARKRPLGPLDGLPIVVKDAFATAGVRTTGGLKRLEQHVPSEDAVVVARLKQAGAIILGKTNLPPNSSDWQSYNELVGQTNNPWDPTRTPGGSTGGGAAALAAGFAFLEVGSDLAGSIRIPSHFCGVYGHKPTLDLVPLRGHVPPGPHGVPASPLSVAGPLARSPEDLLLQLGVLAGPAGDDAIAYKLTLPPPRRARLRDYKLGFVLDDPYCRLDDELREVLAAALERLRKAGVQLVEGWPKGVAPDPAYATYMYMVGATQAPSLSPEFFERMQVFRRQGLQVPWVLGVTGNQRDWSQRNQERLRHRAAWQRYFREHDAFLGPINFVAAPPHDHASEDPSVRLLTTSHGARSYLDQPKWVCFASLSGCPATAVPVGRTRSGLPVGMQIMGPYLEDLTTLDIAAKMADVCGHFVPPPLV